MTVLTAYMPSPNITQAQNNAAAAAASLRRSARLSRPTTPPPHIHQDSKRKRREAPVNAVASSSTSRGDEQSPRALRAMKRRKVEEGDSSQHAGGRLPRPRASASSTATATAPAAAPVTLSVANVRKRKKSAISRADDGLVNEDDGAQLERRSEDRSLAKRKRKENNYLHMHLGLSSPPPSLNGITAKDATKFVTEAVPHDATNSKRLSLSSKQVLPISPVSSPSPASFSASLSASPVSPRSRASSSSSSPRASATPTPTIRPDSPSTATFGPSGPDAPIPTSVASASSSAIPAATATSPTLLTSTTPPVSTSTNHSEGCASAIPPPAHASVPTPTPLASTSSATPLYTTPTPTHTLATGSTASPLTPEPHLLASAHPHPLDIIDIGVGSVGSVPPSLLSSARGGTIPSPSPSSAPSGPLVRPTDSDNAAIPAPSSGSGYPTSSSSSSASASASASNESESETPAYQHQAAYDSFDEPHASASTAHTIPIASTTSTTLTTPTSYTNEGYEAYEAYGAYADHPEASMQVGAEDPASHPAPQDHLQQQVDGTQTIDVAQTMDGAQMIDAAQTMDAAQVMQPMQEKRPRPLLHARPKQERMWVYACRAKVEKLKQTFEPTSIVRLVQRQAREYWDMYGHPETVWAVWDAHADTHDDDENVDPVTPTTPTPRSPTSPRTPRRGRSSGAPSPSPGSPTSPTSPTSPGRRRRRRSRSASASRDKTVEELLQELEAEDGGDWEEDGDEFMDEEYYDWEFDSDEESDVDRDSSFAAGLGGNLTFVEEDPSAGGGEDDEVSDEEEDGDDAMVDGEEGEDLRVKGMMVEFTIPVPAPDRSIPGDDLDGDIGVVRFESASGLGSGGSAAGNPTPGSAMESNLDLFSLESKFASTRVRSEEKTREAQAWPLPPSPVEMERSSVLDTYPHSPSSSSSSLSEWSSMPSSASTSTALTLSLNGTTSAPIPEPQLVSMVELPRKAPLLSTYDVHVARGQFEIVSGGSPEDRPQNASTLKRKIDETSERPEVHTEAGNESNFNMGTGPGLGSGSRSVSSSDSSSDLDSGSASFSGTNEYAEGQEGAPPAKRHKTAVSILVRSRYGMGKGTPVDRSRTAAWAAAGTGYHNFPSTDATSEAGKGKARTGPYSLGPSMSTPLSYLTPSSPGVNASRSGWGGSWDGFGVDSDRVDGMDLDRSDGVETGYGRQSLSRSRDERRESGYSGLDHIPGPENGNGDGNGHSIPYDQHQLSHHHNHAESHQHVTQGRMEMGMPIEYQTPESLQNAHTIPNHHLAAHTHMEMDVHGHVPASSQDTLIQQDIPIVPVNHTSSAAVNASSEGSAISPFEPYSGAWDAFLASLDDPVAMDGVTNNTISVEDSQSSGAASHAGISNGVDNAGSINTGVDGTITHGNGNGGPDAGVGVGAVADMMFGMSGIPPNMTSLSNLFYVNNATEIAIPPMASGIHVQGGGSYGTTHNAAGMNNGNAMGGQGW